MDDDSHPWEENRGMGFSYGYNRAEDAADYRTAQELILMLIDVVSRGGNLCLDIGPSADGKIPVVMQERLLDIGSWLKTNGEAIYGSRMWKVPCHWSAGNIPKTERKEYMSKFNILEQTVAPPDGQAYKEVLFTFKNGNLYAITPKWPGRKLILKNVRTDSSTEITFLGTGDKLSWKMVNNNLLITTPEFDTDRMQSQYAYVFRISNIE
jgi:alpha-L-fucosidase